MALRALIQLDHVEGRPSQPGLIEEAEAIFERLRVIAAPAIPIPAGVRG